MFAEQDKSVDFAACYPECEVVGGKFTFDLETASDTDLCGRTPRAWPYGQRCQWNLRSST